MKLTIERDALVKALAHSAAVVKRANTIPILANVLIDADVESVRLTSTDMDLQLGQTLPAQVAETGAITVAAHLLHDIARELPGGAQVELSHESGGKLIIASGRSRYQLQALPRDDFPVLAPPQPSSEFVLDAKVLASLLGRVAFAQCSELTRYYLCGVHMECADGRLLFVATNGNALAVAECEAPDGADELAELTLPTPFVTQLLRLLGEVSGGVEVVANDKQAQFSVGHVTLTGKLVDGTFPQWRRVVPSANGQKLAIERGAFVGAVRRSQVVASDKTRAVKLGLSRDKLTCTVSSPESGVAVEEAPAVYDAADLTIGFNAKYLLDTFAAIGSDELHVEFGDAASPALFTNPADSAARWVVMPMRV